MTRTIRSLALALGLVSTAVLADPVSVFSCMVSPTEKIEVGLDKGILTYYYQNYRNQDDNRFMPGLPDNSLVSIFRGPTTGFNGRKQETFNITFHQANSPYRIVVSMDVSDPSEGPVRTASGQVLAYHSGKRISTWNCRDSIPNPTALGDALNNRQVSEYRVDSTDITRLGI